jgi:Rrf2 family protein
MLSLPQTAEYALRAVCYIAEHEASGPIPVSEVATALAAPQNYLSKTLHQLRTRGVLRSVRGARGGYTLGGPGAALRLADIVEPFLVETEHRCIMGRARCRDDAPCGAHWRWKEVKDTARAFFLELTVADLLRNDGLAPLTRSAPVVRAAS